MKNWKYIVLCSFLCSAFFSSCMKQQQDILHVQSVDYVWLTELEAETPDEGAINNWIHNAVSTGLTNDCYVSERNGNLIVSNLCMNQQAYTMPGDNGYFVGVDMGEFDSWVMFFPYYSAIMPELVREPEMVVNEHCLGFVKVDNTRGYLFTRKEADHSAYLEHPNIGLVYELQFPTGKSNWECTKIADLEGFKFQFVYDKVSSLIYIATNKSLLSFSTVDHSVVELADLSLWESIGCSSIVQLNGKLYLSMHMGIYEYDLSKSDWKWYPIPSEKYVS